MRPTFTACLIALNEAAVIARALDSLRGLFDEIIVVDGGSSDNTAAIAQAAGARVILEPWRHDFAHARNVAWEAATGDFLFFLDCDETLEPGSIDALRAAALADTHPVYFVRRLDSTPGGFGEHDVVRFGRRRLPNRFVRRIHERVEPPFTSVGRANAVVRHWPSSPAQRHAKHLRNLRLLDLHLLDEPQDLYCRVERMSTKRTLQHPDWMADLATTASLVNWDAHHAPRSGDVHVLVELALLSSPEALPEGQTHLRLTDAAQRWFPRNCVLAGLSCWRLAEAGRWAECIRAGEWALKLWRTRTFDASHPFDPSFLHDQLRATLAEAYRRTGQAHRAKTHTRQRVRLLPREYQAT